MFRSAAALSLAASLAFAGCKKTEVKTPADTPAPAPAAQAPKAAPPPAEAPAAPAAPSDIKVVSGDARGVVGAVFEALSSGALDEALRYYADDHEQSFVVAPLRNMTGKGALKSLWERLRQTFPDARFKARRILDAGSQWFVQAVLLGTQKGQYGPTPPSNKPIGTEIVYFLDVKNGKIKRSASLSNGGAFMKQIGAAQGDHALPTWPETTEVVKGERDKASEEKAKAFYAALSKGDAAATEALVAPTLQVTDHVVNGKTIPWAEHKKRIDAERATFPDLAFIIDDALAVGGYVVVRGTAKGTQKGPFGAIPASGRVVQFKFVDVMKLDGGKLVLFDRYADIMQVMQQLGSAAQVPGSKVPVPHAK